MSGNFAILNATDQLIQDLVKIFRDITYDPQLDADPYHPDTINPVLITNAFNNATTTIIRKAVPRHKYICINAISDIDMTTIDKMVVQLNKAGIGNILERPSIGLKALLTEGIPQYAQESPDNMWARGLKSHALVLSLTKGDVSIEYFKFNGIWV